MREVDACRSPFSISASILKESVAIAEEDGCYVAMMLLPPSSVIRDRILSLM